MSVRSHNGDDGAVRLRSRGSGRHIQSLKLDDDGEGRVDGDFGEGALDGKYGLTE
jgi:hypothetical protein